MKHFFKGKLASLKIGDVVEVVSESGIEGAGSVIQVNTDAVMLASIPGEKGEHSLPEGHPVFAFPADKLPKGGKASGSKAGASTPPPPPAPEGGKGDEDDGDEGLGGD